MGIRGGIVSRSHVVPERAPVPIPVLQILGERCNSKSLSAQRIAELRALNALATPHHGIAQPTK